MSQGEFERGKFDADAKPKEEKPPQPKVEEKPKTEEKDL